MDQVQLKVSTLQVQVEDMQEMKNCYCQLTEFPENNLAGEEWPQNDSSKKKYIHSASIDQGFFLPARHVSTQFFEKIICVEG